MIEQDDGEKCTNGCNRVPYFVTRDRGAEPVTRKRILPGSQVNLKQHRNLARK
ncbi:hypothetical protein CHS0354_000349, partial [Potamilus streckersoni]